MNTNEEINLTEESAEIIITAEHAHKGPIIYPRRLLNVIPVDIKKLLEEITEN